MELIAMSATFDSKLINALVKDYSALTFYQQLLDLVQELFPDKDLNGCSKYELHKLWSDTIISSYKGEEVIKYGLFEKYQNKSNIVGAFEIKVNSSRVDFLTINGSTTSYEIKSELDNFSKLSKQLGDYLLAFEYNYLVVDIKHLRKAEDFLPTTIGLWSYSNGKYREHRKAALSSEINPEMQLKQLSKRELRSNFAECDGEFHEILRVFDSESINIRFKSILKARYTDRWNFIKKNKDIILPIDIQFFFNTNVNPTYVYF